MIVVAPSSIQLGHNLRAVLAHSVLATLVVLGVASSANAQASQEVAPLATVLTGEALTAYDAGRLLFEDGDFRGALSQFRRAYTVAKEPRLLWNMATCEKEQRHYGQAVRLITQFLEVGGESIPPERRQEAAATLEALQGFVSTVELRGVPSVATVLIDGAPHRFEALPQPLSLDLGSHTLRVEAPGYRPFEQQLEVLGKTPLSVVVVMQPLPQLGRLRIEVIGDVGSIRVDNKLVGQGHFEGELAAGEHLISIEASGKRTHSERVTVTNQSNRTLHVTLQDESTRLWPWIVGGALLLAGGGIGGYFLFSDSSNGSNTPHSSLGSIDVD